MPVHAAIAHALRDHGVETLYGLMGDANIFIVDYYVRKLKGRYVPAVHESGAVLMALGHASATGEVGVVTITHGPAVSNAVTALIEGTKGTIPHCTTLWRHADRRSRSPAGHFPASVDRGHRRGVRANENPCHCG